MISADLGKTLESMVSDLVSKGRYNSKSEVLREGVRLIQEREARLALEEDLASAEAEIDQGLGIPAEEVFSRLEAKYRALAEKVA